MEKDPGDGDDNRETERRGYGFRLFNFFLLGQWAYHIFTRMRNMVQAQRRRFVRRRWGIRIMGAGKPVEKPRHRTRNRREDASSGSQDEIEGAAPTEGEGSVTGTSEVTAGPSGLKKGSSDENTSTNVTEAESKEATHVEEDIMTSDASSIGTSTLLWAHEEISDDTDDIDLCTPLSFCSPTQETAPDSEDSLGDEEDTTGGTAEGAADESTNKKNASE